MKTENYSYFRLSNAAFTHAGLTTRYRTEKMYKISGVARNSQWGGGLGNFCNFLIKITHFYAYFGQNNYLKQ